MAEQMTNSQLAVVASHGRSALVSAGAGSGKTWVLVKRLMDSVNSADIEKRTDLDRYLIITYTKAAAAELRAKISEEISMALAEETLKGANSERVKHLRRQNAMVSRAHIGTIHSFCSDVLKEYGGAVGLRPGFKIIEDEKAEAYKAAAVDKILEERYANPDKYPGFIALADTIGAGRDDSKLVTVIRDVYEAVQSHARPGQWIENAKLQADTEWEDLSQSPWGRIVMTEALLKARYLLKCAEDLQKDALEDPTEEKNVGVFGDVAGILRNLVSALDTDNGGSWDRACAFFPCKLPDLAKRTTKNDKEFHDRLNAGKKSIKANLDDIKKYFDAPMAELQADMKKNAPAMKALLDAVLDFQREYIREKRENSLADFSDLEHCTAELLCDSDGNPTSVARELSRRYKEIMVDEYQDVSRVQDTIFRAVSKDGKNLFFVGDIKQSIYRFRLADPSIFKEKLHNWNYYLNYSGDGNVVIPLRENFRSRRSIINGVNSIFKVCMSERLGDIDYSDPTQQLEYGADYAGDGPKPELIIIQQPDSEDGDTPGGITDKVRAEAAAVADMIRSLIESGQTLGKNDKLRRAEYSDVAILLRSPKNSESIFRSELERMNIPVNSGAESDFYSSPEVVRLISLLSIIDNPNKDIELVSVLRSPAFGFTADDLAKIRTVDRKKSLWVALREASETDAACADFILELEELRKAASELSVSELVWHIICRTDLVMLCSAMEDGEVRRNRILKFVELAQKFEDSGYRGLHRFVSWLSRVRAKNEKVDTAASSTEGVTIMSVHKSKGLQFPIVFVCCMGKQFNERDMNSSLLIHPELGIGAKTADLDSMTENNTLNRMAIHRKKLTEGRSEEMRLLYVALTRAQEQLYITGTVSNLESFDAELETVTRHGTPDPESLLKFKDCLRWLGAAAKLDGGENIIMRQYSWEGWAGYLSKKTAAGVYEPSPVELENMARRLERNLSFEYPRPDAVNLPSKVTATGLKGALQPDEEAESLRGISEEEYAPLTPSSFRLPDFALKNKPLGSAERGTATHIVLQHIDFSKTGTKQQLQEEIQRLCRGGFIGEREAAAVDVDAILKLFASDTGRLLLSGGKVRREFRFSILCPAQELLGYGGEEKILLQGVVDCFVETPEGIAIIDYKTDRVFSEAEIKARAENYSPQLKAYASALERICGKPVVESELYFLTPGKAVRLEKK